MGENTKSFIEVQFPVSKVSKESYKERKAGSNQTLTGLGKWWGRKPLILVRSAILGLLLPSSNDSIKDREIFLKILSMDDQGVLKRKNKKIPSDVIFENLTTTEREKYFNNCEEKKSSILFKSKISSDLKETLQLIVFKRLSYDEKLKYCMRPEELESIDIDQWVIINEHLNTNAKNIKELIVELGKKKFGRVPIVGDCFCGGGSIPFEAAKMGCKVYASDLNPLAGLLTWAGLNILNKSPKEIGELINFQEKIYDILIKKIDELGIETNEKGWRAKFYIYCNEIVCPECKFKAPLSPNWIINAHHRTIAVLVIDKANKIVETKIKNNVSIEEFNQASNCGTIKNNNFVCPNPDCKQSTPIVTIRKDKINKNGNKVYGLRKWKCSNFIPDHEDVFHERLYCIKYIDKFDHKTWKEVIKKPAPATDASYGNAYYCNPTTEDFQREEKISRLLESKIIDWQQKGYIPDTIIEEGYNTSQIIRERGWSHWNHLFNSRQLLMHGMIMEVLDKEASSIEENVIAMLGINNCCNWNSKLSTWMSKRSTGGGTQTFNNQALNTLFNYSTRALSSLYLNWVFNLRATDMANDSQVEVCDARKFDHEIDISITDPPYADAVNYHELSEFFLAWIQKKLPKVFPGWYSDSKRALAVTGKGESFNKSMIDIYQNLSNKMTDDGLQIVMFTHQDVKVWAELAVILWSAGLQVITAWNIATETESGGLKDGNYVKGTVLLVLKKLSSDKTAYLDELYPDVEEEVKSQIDNMRNLDDKDDPNFSDADYLLAAYAASLKVLTSYQTIEDIDVSYELSKERYALDESPIEQIINEAVKIAYDYLIPVGFDSFTWKTLLPEERFFIKGLDFEKNGIYQISAYQELARGFGIKEYKDLLASKKANKARLKTATEFAMKNMSENDKFGSSLLRNVFAALHLSIKSENTAPGRNWLKNELADYWNQRSSIIELLDYISTLEHIENMPHWEEGAKYAKRLRELVNSDGV